MDTENKFIICSLYTNGLPRILNYNLHVYSSPRRKRFGSEYKHLLRF